MSIDAANLTFTTAVMPFDGAVLGAGQLAVAPSETTTYEVNGIASSGTVGAAQLAGLATGSMTVSYGTLNTADETTTAADGTATTSSNVSFTAIQVLAGGSVQGAGLDRVSGTVSARSGNTLTVEDGTLIGVDGSAAFIGGTTLITIGPDTVVTVFRAGHRRDQQSAADIRGFCGRCLRNRQHTCFRERRPGCQRRPRAARPHDASGLVAAQGSGTLSLGLVSLGGRAVAAFDFVGSGASPVNIRWVPVRWT